MPKQQSGNPTKRAVQKPKVKPKHAEAHCLMKYRADHRGLEEWIWNSRDAVTPFVITMRDGTIGSHVDWRNDVYAPDHQPKVGDRIFVDLTEERARAWARDNAQRLWDKPPGDDTDLSYSVQNEFASVDQLAEYLLRSYLEEIERGAPDLIEVTEEYARAHGWPVERNADRLKQVLPEEPADERG